MEIHYVPRIDRIGKNGQTQIRIYVYYQGKELRLSTGEKIAYPDDWDTDRERVKSRAPFARIINQKLDNMSKVLDFVYQVSEKSRIELDNTSYRSVFEKVYDQVIASGFSSTRDEFTRPIIQDAYEQYLKSINEPETETETEQKPFIQLMWQWIDEEKERIIEHTGRKMSANTVKGIKSTIKRFEEFEKHRGQEITFEGMDKYFYAEFRAYMLEHLDQGVNNFGKHVRRLKQFLSWSEDHDEQLPVNPKYMKFSAPSRYKGVDFLLPEELQALEALNFQAEPLRSQLEFTYPDKHINETLRIEAFKQYLNQLELARDIFLMCCYSSLRISDAQNLLLTDLKGELIIVDAQKTGDYCYIPFYDDAIFKPVALVNKYRNNGLKIFPSCPKINKHLKTIQKLAEIDRLVLTTKIGRKTFATTKIYMGVPRSIVMQATGHKTEVSFNRYLGVNEPELLKIFKQSSAMAS